MRLYWVTSVRSRLILAFASIILLTVVLIGSGFVYILREFQSQREMDRLAGLATALQGQIRQIEISGMSRDEITEYIRRSSDELDVGIVLIGPGGVIAFDSEDQLVGRRLDLNNATRIGPVRRMRVAALTGDDDLLFVVVTPLFAPNAAAQNQRERNTLSLGLVTKQQSVTSAWM